MPSTQILKTVVEAQPHTPVYLMHKYFARRPWNVFRQIIGQYSSAGEIVLDPFCGGGTTVVESLKLRRKAIGVDVNPIATYITEMECIELDSNSFHSAFSLVTNQAEQEILSLYRTRCGKCGSDSTIDWVQWKGSTIVRVRSKCPKCGKSGVRGPSTLDIALSRRISRDFDACIKRQELWYPKTRIPNGDKTDSLLNQDVTYFSELFTKRNLLALSMLLKAIDAVKQEDARRFLKFAFSGSLKWASKQSHLRGNIVEGWAMHAYWIYPLSLEMNVWNIFERRIHAILRAKDYCRQHIGEFSRITSDFEDLKTNKADCLILNRSSTELPIPDESVDAIITDPPYGGNVNYAELSDFWSVWTNKGSTIEKTNEVVINRSQHKTLADYELLLYRSFTECYRVLKPRHHLVCTFNSKDLKVVSSFIVAVSRAGFVLHPDGLLYQKPIRAYNTTIHAMQIGAFVGDFIFTFVKEKLPRQHITIPAKASEQLCAELRALVEENVRIGVSDVELREKAYRILIPFIAEYASVDLSTCREIVDFFETKMDEHSEYFKGIRMKATEARLRKFHSKKIG
jgi:putative DNA methylase